MIKINIIIVTYNDLEHTRICLESLNNIDRTGLTIQTTVIDNASGLFNPDILKQEFPEIALIINTTNVGFGRANNIGIRQALIDKADFILLLNPDTKIDIDKKWLIKLLNVFEKDTKISIAGPVMEHKVNENTYCDYGGILDIKLVKAKHVNKLKGARPLGGAKSYNPPAGEAGLKAEYVERDFISAACMLIKREVVEKAGIFDPGYFLYLEDVDYCLNVRRYGYKIVNVYSSRIFHHGGTSGNDNSKIFYSYLSSIRFTLKWTPLINIPISILYNSLFYPYLWISWSLKRVKRSWLKLR